MYRGLILNERAYTTPTTPPASFEDRSRHGHNGTFVNHTAWVRQPSGIWVSNFDIAQDDAIQIPTPCPYLDLTYHSFTMMAWVKRTALVGGNNMYLFGKGAFNVNGWNFYVQSTGEINFQTCQTGASQSTTSASVVQLGKWCLLAITRSGTSVLAYYNGLLSTGAAGVHADPLSSSTVNCIIGNNTGFNRAWYGQQTLHKIYNYTLSADQIRRIFQSERGWFGV
jgi:hypothetical protein